MKRSLVTTLAAATSLATLGSSALAQRDLTVVSWGGAYQDGQKEVYFKPFNASGTKLVDDAGRTMDDIVSQVKRVSEFVSQHPDETVSILRSWLHETA